MRRSGSKNALTDSEGSKRDLANSPAGETEQQAANSCYDDCATSTGSWAMVSVFLAVCVTVCVAVSCVQTHVFLCVCACVSVCIRARADVVVPDPLEGVSPIGQPRC